jgi:Tol biopolymer transport system component
VEEVMAFRRFGVLIVASVVGLAVGVAPAFGTESSGENGRIAFASDRDGDYDIWSIRPDGSGLVNLTADSEAFDFGPNWRPDGRKLAFMSNRVTPANPGPDPDVEIFVMNADGSRMQQLTANTLDDDYPSWSPDGRRLVFSRDFDPRPMEVDYDLFTMRADGSRQRNLTRSPGINDRDGDWSPDGRRIAFDSDRDGEFEIYRMRADGGDQTRLTFTSPTSPGPPGRRTAAGSPSTATLTRTLTSTRCGPTAATRPG